MTIIIRIILIQAIYLYREKDSIPFSIIYSSQTGASGFGLCH